MCTQKNVYKSTGFGGNFLGMGQVSGCCDLGEVDWGVFTSEEL